MRKLYPFIFLFFTLSLAGYSQQLYIAGHVQDTLAKEPLKNAVVMGIRLSDSVLVAFTRTNELGYFKIDQLPVDTYQVVISHPKFGDQYFIAIGSSSYMAFDFGKIILPPKSVDMKEVIIYAYKDPVYFKGDTLIYTADSFKVKQNATVEDLLKKLPGIKVDAQGKITSQGKQVDQVLVDGDEFFGNDPTIATRNLGATTVESVQVYDKKNESTADGAAETIKVMNLKLKEDAKKGYFGKIAGASDFTKFYEGEFLANKFKGKQKISVFALGSNTPKSSFDWSDVFKYGLDNQMNMMSNDDGMNYYMMSDDQGNGIPQTLKTGAYYNDKITSKTKLAVDYAYQNNRLTSGTEKTSQYFLTDTTYKTTNKYANTQANDGHVFNLRITHQIDSLTEIEFKPKLVLNKNATGSNETTDFITSSEVLSRNTSIVNTNKESTQDLAGNFRLRRNFNKKERLLLLTYGYDKNTSNAEGILNSYNTYYNIPGALNDTIDQQKLRLSDNQTHSAAITFTEPINAKIKLEFSYDYYFYKGLQNKKTSDYAGGSYSLENLTLSNNFENSRNIHRLGAKFIYEVKKYRFTTGTKVRQLQAGNTNLITHQTISQLVNNVLPFMSFRYKFSDNKNMNFKYSSNATQPDLNQLQPVPDNTNPNQIRLGNPDLRPSFKQSFQMDFSSFKVVSGQNIWSGLNFTTSNNDITTVVSYDNLGRTVSKPVNVNGNYNGSCYIGAQLPVFSKLFSLNPQFNGNYSNDISYINDQKNTTKTARGEINFSIDVQREKFDFSIGNSFSYTDPSSTLNNQSNKPYASQQYNYSFNIKLPKNFSVESDGNYNINSKRSNGYNISYFLLNASVNKTFLKTENLIVSLVANDILNQNISTNRSVNYNVITDTKTNIIRRYILLKAVLKFNNNKTKEGEDEF